MYICPSDINEGIYASSVANSLKLGHVDISTWMGDQQGRPGNVNMGLFVGVGINSSPIVYITVIMLT